MRPTTRHQRFTPAPLALAAAIAITLAAGHAPRAQAQGTAATETARSIAFNIPAQPLGQALNELARQANLQLSFPAALVAGKQAPAVVGPLTVPQALERLLAGQRLAAAVDGASVILHERPAASDHATLLPTVRVVASAERPGDLPAVFAGGQVAKGARMGVLGNQNVMDTPFSVTSYTAELMENRQARTVADVLTSDPTVRNTVTTGHQYENFKVRGFTVSRGDFAIDGLFGMSGNSNSTIEMFERVELLKGPSVLFTGMAPSGGVGAVVNMVPKRAGDEALTRLSLDVQSASQVGANLDIGRRFGDNQAFGVRINARLADGETTMQAQDRRREFLSVALDYRGQALKASLDAYSSKEKVSGGVGAMFWFATTGMIPAAPDPSISQFPSAKGELDAKAVIARAEYEFTPNVSAFAAVGTAKYGNTGFVGGSILNSINASGTSTSSLTYGTLGYQNNQSAEVGLRAIFTTGALLHEMVLQGSQLESKTGTASNTTRITSTNIYNPTYVEMPAVPSVAPLSSKSAWTGLTLADAISAWNDRLKLTLAVREQRVDTSNFSASTGAVTSTYDQSAWVPSLGVVLKPWGDDLSLYANHVRGLSQGESVTKISGYAQDYTFAPYKTQQYEFGLKWNQGRFMHTASLYQLAQPQLISAGTAPSLTASINGEKRVRGLEWSTAGNLVDSVRLLGGIAYTHGVQTKTQGGLTDGKNAVGVPRWQANLGAEWDTPWLPGLTLTGQVTATSSQYLDAANTLSIPGWALLDLGVRYSTQLAGKKVVTKLGVSNAMDRHYYSGSFRDTRAIANLGAGRTVSASVSVDF